MLRHCDRSNLWSADMNLRRPHVSWPLSLQLLSKTIPLIPCFVSTPSNIEVTRPEKREFFACFEPLTKEHTENVIIFHSYDLHSMWVVTFTHFTLLYGLSVKVSNDSRVKLHQRVSTHSFKCTIFTYYKSFPRDCGLDCRWNFHVATRRCKRPVNYYTRVSWKILA